MSVAADIEKNVAEHSAATHRASNVLPADIIILFSIEVMMLEQYLHVNKSTQGEIYRLYQRMFEKFARNCKLWRSLV